jgi:hypothetical protein
MRWLQRALAAVSKWDLDDVFSFKTARCRRARCSRAVVAVASDGDGVLRRTLADLFASETVASAFRTTCFSSASSCTSWA